MAEGAIDIRPLCAADAEALVACFERCYGDTYPAEAFHDPARVATLLEAGQLRSVVAIAPGDGVVGHMGLSLRPEPGLTAEAGNTVVDPRYRGHRLAARLAAELARLCLASGCVGFHHYPTTAHPVMQKLAVAGGGVETGVLLDYIPAATSYVGFAPSAAGRVAVVAVYQPLAVAPGRRVWLPARHRALARALYERAGIAREVAHGAAPMPDAAARVGVRHEERRGLLRIEVEAIGGDLCERVADALERVPGAPALIDLPLAGPGVDTAVEALAANRFFFGALLPEYTAAGDVLRLQRPAAVPPAPPLATSGGRALWAYTAADRDRSGSLENAENGPTRNPPASIG